MGEKKVKKKGYTVTYTGKIAKEMEKKKKKKNKDNQITLFDI